MHSLVHLPIHSLIHSFTHHSFIHSPIHHSFISSLIHHSFTHYFTHSPIYSPIHSFIHFLPPSLIPLLSHSLTHSLTHSYTHSLADSYNQHTPRTWRGAGCYAWSSTSTPGVAGCPPCAWPVPTVTLPPEGRVSIWVRPCPPGSRTAWAPGSGSLALRGRRVKMPLGGKSTSTSPHRVRTPSAFPTSHQSLIDQPSDLQPTVVSVETRVPGEAWGVGSRRRA